MRLIEDRPEGVGTCSRSGFFDAAILVDGLRRIGDGECVMDPTIVGRRREKGPLADLTGREREVLSLVGRDRSRHPRSTGSWRRVTCHRRLRADGQACRRSRTPGRLVTRCGGLLKTWPEQQVREVLMVSIVIRMTQLGTDHVVEAPRVMRRSGL